jgi:hypothetical protein
MVYQLYEWWTVDTGPDWTTDYRREERLIGTFETLERAKEKQAEVENGRKQFWIDKVEVTP